MRESNSTFPKKQEERERKGLKAALPVAPGLARLHELATKHPCQPQQTSAEQGQRSRLRSNDLGRVVVGDRDCGTCVRNLGLVIIATRELQISKCCRVYIVKRSEEHTS